MDNVAMEEKRQVELATKAVDKLRKLTVKTVTVTDEVTLHILPNANSRQVATVVHTLTELQKNYPAPGKVEVFFPVLDMNFTGEKPHPNAIVQGGTLPVKNGVADFDGNDRVIAIAKTAATNSRSYPGYHMPSFDAVSQLSAVLVHEWGHVIDNRKMSQLDIAFRFISAGLMNWHGELNPIFFSSLSEYGQENENESYAEAFAEWALTGGNTNNFASLWYGHEYKWPMNKLEISKERNYSPMNRYTSR